MDKGKQINKKPSPLRRSKRSRSTASSKQSPVVDLFPSPGRKRQRKPSQKAEESRAGQDEKALKEFIRPKRKNHRKKQIADIESQSQSQSMDKSKDSSLDDLDMVCCLCHCTVDYSDMDQFNWPQEETDSDSDEGSSEELSVSSSDTASNGEEDTNADKKDHNKRVDGRNHQENKTHNHDTKKKSDSQLSETKASSFASREKESLTTQSLPNHDESSEESDFYGVKLPNSLHDPNNALLICDGAGCNRCFHQRCHFIPVLSVPRRNWYCLICEYKAKRIAAKKGKRGRTPKSSKIDAGEMFEGMKLQKTEAPTIADLDNIYRVVRRPTIPVTGTISAVFTAMNGAANARAASNTPLKMDQAMQEEIIAMEQRFEHHSAQLKAELIRKGSQHLVKTIDHNLSSIRLCQNSIRALIETNNRARKALIEKYNKIHQLPQELVQNVMRLARCKLKLREVMHTLQYVIRNKDDRSELLEWFMRAKSEGRFTPAKICQKDPPVPSMISLEIHKSDGIVKQAAIGIDIILLETKLFAGDPSRKEPRFDIKDYDADADDESEEEDPTNSIKCCICFSGHVEEEDDVIMCDGEHCFRALHMKCCAPHVTQKNLDEDTYGVWFCPYCVCFAKTLHYTQTEYEGFDIDEDASVKSWEKVEAVFPEAQTQIKAAEKWKLGKRNENSDKVLAEMLGIEIATVPSINDVVGEVNSNGGDDDDDDDDDESEFGSDAGSDGSSKSNASDDSGASVDWGVKKSEVSALSCSESESDGEEESMETDQLARKSKRLRKNNSQDYDNSDSSKQSPKDVGAMSKANIVRGKRSRAKVDYNSLNDSMFGPGKAIAVDDEEEYQFVMKKSRKRDSENDDSESENEIDNSHSDDSSNNGNEKKNVNQADKKYNVVNT